MSCEKNEPDVETNTLESVLRNAASIVDYVQKVVSDLIEYISSYTSEKVLAEIEKKLLIKPLQKIKMVWKIQKNLLSLRVKMKFASKISWTKRQNILAMALLLPAQWDLSRLLVSVIQFLPR